MILNNLNTRILIDSLIPLFSALPSDGFRLTVDDYQRIELLLGSTFDWTRDRVRDALATIITADPKEESRFIRRFDEIFPEDFRLFDLSAIQEECLGFESMRHVSPDDGFERIEDRKPDTDVSKDVARSSDSWPKSLVMTDVFLIPGTLHFEISHLRREDAGHGESGISWDRSKPMVFRMSEVGGKPEPWISKDTMAHLADSMGYFQANAPGRDLDVPGSIAATIENGGVPAFVLLAPRKLRSLMILEDATDGGRVWNPVAQELATGMENQGVNVIRGVFHGLPGRFITDTREVHHLEDFEDDRQGLISLVFSDGNALGGPESRIVLDELRTWPQLAWIVTSEPQFRHSMLNRLTAAGIAVYQASHTGISSAMQSFLTERGSGDPGRRSLVESNPLYLYAGMRMDAYIPAILGNALPWAEVCALLQPVSRGLADTIRRNFFPHLQPECIERMHQLPGSAWTESGLVLTHDVTEILVKSFKACNSKSRQTVIFNFLMRELSAANPRGQEAGIGLSDVILQARGYLLRKRFGMEIDTEQERLLFCTPAIRSFLASSVHAMIPREENQVALESILEGIQCRTAKPGIAPPETMSYIPAGKFMMGDPSEEGYSDERPRHDVHTDAFYIDKNLTSKAEWDEVSDWARSHGYEFDHQGDGSGTDHPVTHVSWHDVAKWANARSEKSGRRPVYYVDERKMEVYRTGKLDLTEEMVDWEADGFRLPTEAEWEKAARGRLDGQHYPWPNKGELYSECIDSEKAWYSLKEWGDRKKTCVVGHYAPNGYGLYDMAGNAWEWVWDRFDSGFYQSDQARTANTRGPSKGSSRVYRGGGWIIHARFLRCSYRNRGGPDFARADLGFRLALGQPWKPEEGERSGEDAGKGAKDERPASERPSEAVDNAPAFFSFATQPEYKISAVLSGKDEPAGQKFETSQAEIIVYERDWRLKMTARGFLPAEAELTTYGGMETSVLIKPENGILPEMALIPAGDFMKGDPTKEGYEDERPRHRVFTDAFYLDRYLVTRAMWNEVADWAKRRGYRFANEGSDTGPDHPVTHVSWHDVVKWANARSEMAGRTPVYYADAGRKKVFRSGKVDLTKTMVDWAADGFRLPSEAEWEKAARGGLDGHHYPWASKGRGYKRFIDESKAWYSIKEYDDRKTTCPVGQFAPNGYGLYDMAGNAWEWVWDWFDTKYYASPRAAQPNPRGPLQGSGRVCRGGSWDDLAWNLRCSCRGRGGPVNARDFLGFRLALGQPWKRSVERSVEGAGEGAKDERPASERESGAQSYKSFFIRSIRKVMGK